MGAEQMVEQTNLELVLDHLRDAKKHLTYAGEYARNAGEDDRKIFAAFRDIRVLEDVVIQKIRDAKD